MKHQLPGSGTRPRRIWAGMKARCKSKTTRNYGAKGITYDPKWETFAGFWEDMAEGYADHLTIDRKDSNGNYGKGNCRWATYKEQMANFSGNTHLTHNGVTQILSTWAEHLGITKQSLIARVRKYGAGADQTFAVGRQEMNRPLNPYTVAKWAEIRKRLKAGETQLALAKEYKVTQSAISHHIKKYGTE